MRLELHQPLPERLATCLPRCLLNGVDYIFGIVGGQILPNVSALPIQNELDFLRFLIDHDIRLHGTDSFLWVVTCCGN